MTKHPTPRGILLASFLTTEVEEEVLAEVTHLAETANLTNQWIFLLEDIENPAKKILTYNAATERGKPYNSRLFTMRVHRKKQTNTLYTINALNLAVAKEHGGQKGRHLKIDWEKYRESLLLAVQGKLVVHRVKVSKIFKIEDPPADDPSDE